MHNLINNNTDILGNKRIPIEDEEQTGNNLNKDKGISIIEIMQKKKNDVLEKIILENNE